MNRNSKTRTLTIAALLAAITFILGVTPVGYIPLGAIEITLLCIPVLIGALMEGWLVGLFLGLIFGLTSFLQIFIGFRAALGQFLLSLGPVRTLAVIFVPRLLVPVVARGVFLLMNKARSGMINKAAYSVSALAGSATNTVFFLGMMYLLFLPQIDQISEAFGTTAPMLLSVIGSIVLTNGVPEAIAAVVIVTAVCMALARIYRRPDVKPAYPEEWK